MVNTTRIANLTARGAARSQRQAGKQGPFDVWTNTVEGLEQNSAKFHEDPIGTMRDDWDSGVEQLKALHPSEWESSSHSDTVDAFIEASEGVGDAAFKVSEADGALATFGAAFGTLVALEQALSVPFSMIPFPAFPAVRITDQAIGLPHAHMHPPNLTPPNPVPVPMPSAGPVIPIPFISGAATVLINNMPAGRCGDMGMGIWCGGYFPMYEIFLGSSSVWLEGARAARIGMDITKHCIFSTPKPSDLPVGPMVGATVSASPNVIIGGFPLPSLSAMAMGKAFGAMFKGLGKLKGLMRAADDVAEEAAEAGARVARQADEAVDLMAEAAVKSRRIKRLGAKRMTAAQRRAIGRQAAEYGANVRRLSNKQFDELAGANVNAAFNNQTNTILLRRDATLYEAFHELQHARHMNEIGSDAYKALGDGDPNMQRYLRERYVYDRVMENSDDLGLLPAQKGHATDYIRNVSRRAGQSGDMGLPPNAKLDDVHAYYNHMDEPLSGRDLESFRRTFGE